MVELAQENVLLGIALIFILGLSLELLVAFYMFFSLRFASKERAQLNKEMFGILKRIEGLTASRREQVLKHYDTMLQELSYKLPPTIAAQTSSVIFETESKILSRLAELEPNLKNDEVGKKRMDDLIRSMEKLEQNIVGLTADTVSRIMSDSRRNLLDDDISSQLFDFPKGLRGKIEVING